MDEIHAPDVVHHDPSNPEDTTRSDGIKSRVQEVTADLPDFELTVKTVVVEDDNVMVRWTVSAIHEGEFAGMPPMGEGFEGVQGIIIHRFADGRIVEEWAGRDTLGMLQPLGVAPGPD